MDTRRAARTVIDPKVRQVGFFTAGTDQNQPETSSSPSPLSHFSPSGDSLSPVMIPPPIRFPDANNNIPVGSYNPATDFSDKDTKSRKVGASSLPSRGFEMSHKLKVYPATSLTTVSVVSTSPNLSEKNGLSTGPQNESIASSKPSKDKISKAERRAVQEAERAAKGTAKPLKEKTSKAERRAAQEAERAAKGAAKGA